MISTYPLIYREPIVLPTNYQSSKYPGKKQVTPVQKTENDPLKREETRYGTLLDIII